MFADGVDSFPTDADLDLAEENETTYPEIVDEDVSGLVMTDDELMSATRRFIMSSCSEDEKSVEEFQFKHEIAGRQSLADMAKREMDYVRGPSLSGNETEA